MWWSPLYICQLMINMKSPLGWLIDPVSLYWRKLTFPLPVSINESSVANAGKPQCTDFHSLVYFKQNKINHNKLRYIYHITVGQEEPSKGKESKRRHKSQICARNPIKTLN